MSRSAGEQTRVILGYALGGLLVLLGLPLFWGYLGAVFPLVIGVAILARTRRRTRRM